MMTTKYIPAGWRILIEVIEKETEELKAMKSAKNSGIAIPDEIYQKKAYSSQAGSEKARVIAIGDYCWKVRFETAPWCKVGDEILFVQYAGRTFKHDDFPDLPEGQYRIINDEDVIAVVTKSEK